MPALVGKTYTKAKQTLEAMGLRVKKQTRYSSAPGGEVLVQSRKSGSVVSPGLAVTLTVAIAIPPAVNGNPWGYNWACCKTITSPPSEFCSYFVCVRTFWNGTGFVVQCNDDQLSKTGGTGRQTCSGHEGHERTLYAP
jgi:hypothetical protein